MFRRTHVFVIAFCFISVSAICQTFFDAGIKGSWGPTMMFNSNILDDRSYNNEVSFGYTYGAKLGVSFAGRHGVTVDYANATSKQDFEFTFNDEKGNKNNYVWKHHDVMLMYRYSSNGVYVEVGPKISLVSDVSQNIFDAETAMPEQYFADQYSSVVFGFGSYLAGSDVLTIQLGLRLHWGLTDMISDTGKEQNYPAVTESYDPYKSTLPVAVQIGMEVNYAFGRLAKQTCGARNKLILFR